MGVKSHNNIGLYLELDIAHYFQVLWCVCSSYGIGVINSCFLCDLEPMVVEVSLHLSKHGEMGLMAGKL